MSELVGEVLFQNCPLRIIDFTGLIGVVEIEDRVNPFVGHVVIGQFVTLQPEIISNLSKKAY